MSILLSDFFPLSVEGPAIVFISVSIGFFRLKFISSSKNCSVGSSRFGAVPECRLFRFCGGGSPQFFSVKRGELVDPSVRGVGSFLCRLLLRGSSDDDDLFFNTKIPLREDILVSVYLASWERRDF
jgi:hypothetical protein